MKVFRNVAEGQSVNVPTAKFRKSACPSFFQSIKISSAHSFGNTDPISNFNFVELRI